MSTGKAWKLLSERAPLLYAKYYSGEGNHSALIDVLAQTKLLLSLEEYVKEEKEKEVRFT